VKAQESPIPYGRQLIEQDDIDAVVRVMKSDALTQGPEVTAFENELAAAVGARHAVCVSSGTAALHLACIVAGVRPGSMGITSPITFVASANAIRYAGGRPRFADVDPRTALVSEGAIRALSLSSERPQVIVPVDFAGTPADLPKIAKTAGVLGAHVIEDAAHALGARYRGPDGTWVNAASCTHSAMAILSFHPVKHITSGEGGAITTNDRGLYEELVRLRTHGITKDPARLRRPDPEPWYYEQQSLGWNYRMSDIHAALGRSQLRKLPRFLERRREIAQQYGEAFRRLGEFIQPLTIPEGCESSYHLYPVSLVRRPRESLAVLSERRRELYASLREDGVHAQVHYIPVPRQPDFEHRGLVDAVPGADAYYAGAISLPIFPAMTDQDTGRVIAAVSRASQSFQVAA
jgi:UDP-4-amino-4,6-dideoxy-N-acetyl-beta-L-altrosamine transaminase